MKRTRQEELESIAGDRACNGAAIDEAAAAQAAEGTNGNEAPSDSV